MQHKTPESKVCPQCKIEKPSSEFNLNSARADGLTYVCAKCIPAYEAKEKKHKTVLQNLTKKCVFCGRTLPARMYLYDQNSKDKLRSKCRTCSCYKGKNSARSESYMIELKQYENFIKKTSLHGASKFNTEKQRSRFEEYVYQQMNIADMLGTWKPPVWIHKTSIPE
jgi:hypothetical protein